MAKAISDCKELLDFILLFAIRMLENDGHFAPFGCAMHADGRVVAIGGDRIDPALSIKSIQKDFRTHAANGNYKATALVQTTSVTLENDFGMTDAIRVNLDHRDDYSIIVYLYYEIAPNSTLTMGGRYAAPGTGDIFSPR